MTRERSPLCKLTAAGVRWQVVRTCQDHLFGPDGLRLAQWLRDGDAQVIKHGPHRTVYRVAIGGSSYFLKHYRLADLRAWLRQLVRPAKARIEFERALAVAARSVPTVDPVALGESQGRLIPRESYLITRGLDEAETLSGFLEDTLSRFDPLRQTRIRQRVARALGEFVARLHEAGIQHRDLHAANILIRLDADDRPRLHLIDLHAVYLGHALSWRTSRTNLVLLNRWFIVRASRSDRRRFWRAYCQTRARLHVLPGNEEAQEHHDRESGRELEQLTWRSNLRFWRHRDERCRRANRYYRQVSTPGVAGFAVADLDAEELRVLVQDPDAPFRRPGVRLLKDSGSATVAEVDATVSGVRRRMIYKRFRVTTWTDPLTSLLRPPPALRSWVAGHGLRERCLPTPRPLAVLHRRLGPMLYEGYLLTELVPDAVDLHGFVAGLRRLPPAVRRHSLRTRVDQVARLVRELHRRQASQRDLKAANLLLTADAVWLIDLVGLSVHRLLSRARRVQNLARLHASFAQSPDITNADKLRFLRQYLQWGLFGRSGWKTWWRQIAEVTAAKVARNARSGRKLA